MKKDEYNIFNVIDKMIDDLKKENEEIRAQVNKCFYYDCETASNQEMRYMFYYILERDKHLLETIYQMNIDQMLIWTVIYSLFKDEKIVKKIIEEEQLKKEIEENLIEQRKKAKKNEELFWKKWKEEWKAENDKILKEKIEKMKEENKR